MNLSDFTLMKEDATNYTIGHPDGKSLTFPKQGLSDKAHSMIKKLKAPVQNFDEGGVTQSATDLASLPKTPAEAEQQQVQKDAAADASSNNFWYGKAASDQPGADSAPAPADPVAPRSPASTPAAPDADFPIKTLDASAYATAENDIKQGAEAEAERGKSEADTYQQAAEQVQKAQDDFKTRMAAYQAKDAQFEQQIQNGHIDPDRYWNNQSTGSKIASAIGLALSGLGSGLSGQPNMAMAMINKSIDNDISAQMNDQGKNMNLWKMNREAMGNDQAATLATQNNLLGVAKVKAMQAQAAAQGDVAKARIAPEILAIEEQRMQNNNKLAALGMANTPAQTNGAGGLGQKDPATLVPALVPKEQQAKVFDEIKYAQNVKSLTPKILAAFDEATKAGFAKTVPGLESAGQKAFSGLINTTVQETEGTARAAAFKSIEDKMRPQFGDSAETLASKRRTVVDYLSSKSAAPNAKAFGIDLAKFASTAPQRGGTYAPGTIVSVKGKNYTVGPDGNTLK